MTHISGVVYEGLWRNNEPEAQASQIVIDLPDKQTHIEVVQGKRFSLQLKLTTRDGSLATGKLTYFYVCRRSCVLICCITFYSTSWKSHCNQI